jgi:hypothetical protein
LGRAFVIVGLVAITAALIWAELVCEREERCLTAPVWPQPPPD